MDLFLQLLANGLSNGSHYALLGIGFGMIFGTTGIVHFAYGPIFALSAYIMWGLATWLGLPFPIAIAGGIIASGLLGAGSYLILYEPFIERKSRPFVILVASLGLFIVVSNLLGILFGTDVKALTDFHYQVFFVGDTAISSVQISQIVVFILVALLLTVFLKYSSYGNAIRAVTDNVELARILGLDTRKIAILVFAIGSMIAAIPAAHVLARDGVSTGIGFIAVFYAFSAVAVGGVGSIWGAAVGGLLIGMIESIGMWKLPTEWQSTIAFAVLFVVLLWRPTGLLRGG
jgi:branched-chain amino acid transport system permease protein